MSDGWIKLHRSIWDHWIWRDPARLRCWLDLIMLANHKPKKINIDSQIITVEGGQHWTSEDKLVERWGWGKKKVRNFLKLLVSDGMIYKEGTPRGTLITIVNYELYQGFENPKGKAEGKAEGTTEEPPRKNRGPTNKNDIRMIKNDKEIGGRQ